MRQVYTKIDTANRQKIKSDREMTEKITKGLNDSIIRELM